MKYTPSALAPVIVHYVNEAHTANLKHDFIAAKEWSTLAVRIDSSIPEAWYNLALAERGLGNSSEAVRALNQTAHLTRNSPDAQNSVGLQLTEMGELGKAEMALRRATQLAPDFAPPYSNLAKLLQRQGRLAEAETLLRSAIQLAPLAAVFHVNLCSVLLDLERPTEAMESAEKAVALAPTDPNAWCNLGSALDSLGRLEEAIQCHDRALSIQPDFVHALYNRGNALNELGRTMEALACYEGVIALAPNHADAQLGIGEILFAQGKLEVCWEKFEHRWNVRFSPPMKLHTRKPAWNGRAGAQKVLLWGEQGVGDQILHASLLPSLNQLAAQPKVVALERRLLPLFKRSMPELDFVDLATVSDQLDFSEQFPTASLPLLLKPSVKTLRKEQAAFLKADPALTASLRQRLHRNGKLVCGISWFSNRKMVGAYKSVELEQLALALSGTHLELVNLQYGDTERECRELYIKHGQAIQNVPDIDNYNDLDGLAALVSACDVIVTVSNTTAHLAGALGTETLLLLPFARGKLWYWADLDGHNVWYPSVKSYRQTQRGDWSTPLAAVKHYLDSKPWN